MVEEVAENMEDRTGKKKEKINKKKESETDRTNSKGTTRGWKSRKKGKRIKTSKKEKENQH